MKFLPFDNITYRTNLKEEEVKKRFNSKVAPRKFFDLTLSDNDYDKPYKGSITENSFRIQRKISYRNSIVPVINGTIESEMGETKIYFQIRLTIYNMIFMVVWCCMVLYTSTIISFGNSYNGSLNPVVLIPVGMVLLAYFITIYRFNRESNIAKRDWQKFLEADIVN